MQGLLSLLLFAVLFYFMMRFGCGAHMVHGHGGSKPGDHAGHRERGGQQEDPSAIDPVCGMAVAPGQGYAKPHAGHEYRFCSRACLAKFETTPDRYATVAGGAR